MKKLYTFLLSLFITTIVFSQNVIAWQKALGGSNSDGTGKIIHTMDGGYIAVGGSSSIDGDLTFNNGGRDAWVIKLSGDGNIEWQRSYGGPGDDGGSDIIQTSDGGYIILGITDSIGGDVSNVYGKDDFWVIKIDGAGNMQWENSFGGSEREVGHAICSTINGDYIIVGRTESNDGNVTGNHGLYDAWVVKINSIGNIIWQKVYGGSASDGMYSIQSTSDGGFVLLGNTYSNDGDVSGNNGNSDYWILKIDSAGNLVWQKCYGGSDQDGGNYIEVTSDGGFIMNGTSYSMNNGDVTGNHGGGDYWFVKTDSAGNLEWQKCLGGSLYEFGRDITQTIDGGYVAVGSSYSNDGDVSFHYGLIYDWWVVKTDSIGNIEWEKSLGGLGFEEAQSVIQNTDGTYIIAGNTASNDNDVSGNHGSEEAWVVKLTETFNSITGNVFIDLNSNFNHDVGEPILVNHLVTETTSGRVAITNQSGFYDLSVIDTGNFNITTISSLPFYTPNPLVHSIYFAGMNEIDSLRNFAFQPVAQINDLQVSLTPVGAFRPGFNAYYNIKYKNIGTTVLSASIIFKPDTELTFSVSSVLPTNITVDSVVWTFPPLNPFDEGNIIITVIISPNAMTGSIITSKAIIEPASGDTTPVNNTATWDVTVTGSFDPNDILVNRETIFTNELLNPLFLEYLIRFQNTGTDTAFTVKIKNPMPVDADFSTFEFLESSHTVQLNYNNAENVMWFNFDNILLPDSNINELLSHGFIRYRIKPVTNLIVGDSILNSASIFFDFNAPVITNTAVTEIVIPISTPEIEDNFNFSLFPNPTHGELNALFTVRNDVTVEMQVFNNLGQIVKTISGKKMKAGNNKITFSTENMHPGIYHLQLLIDGEAITRKLVIM